MKKIILASASPRRKELLKNIGLDFEIDVSNCEEIIDKKLKPHEIAQSLSLQKAKEVAKRHKDSIIIGADTIVVINNEIIGKPKDEKDATRILKKLSGNIHMVITGFTIIDTQTKKTVTDFEETKVYFRKLSNNEIKSYVDSGEPLGKAGAYAIHQRAGIFVEKTEGDFFNVVGLPIYKLVENLKKEFGIKI